MSAWRIRGLAGASASLGVLLIACAEDPAALEKRELRAAAVAACPDLEDEAVRDRHYAALRRADPDALDCAIATQRWLNAPFGRRSISALERAGVELAELDDALTRFTLFRLLYHRWRAGGDDYAELSALAREMQALEVEDAMLQLNFDARVRFAVPRDLCGGVDESAPGFEFIEMAQGERQPCPR